jgi:hypothetical protein
MLQHLSSRASSLSAGRLYRRWRTTRTALLHATRRKRVAPRLSSSLRLAHDVVVIFHLRLETPRLVVAVCHEAFMNAGRLRGCTLAERHL